MTTIDIDGGPNSEHIATVRPRRDIGDIRAIRAVHGDERLFVTLRFATVRRDRGMEHWFVLKTGRARYSAYVNHRGDGPARLQLDKHRSSDDVECTGFASKVNLVTDRLRISIPRECLDDPRQIRVGVETAMRSKRGSFAIDEGLHRGRDDSDWRFHPLALSPALSSTAN